MKTILEAFAALRQQWRIHRIHAAKERLEYLLAFTPRYWRALSIGGNTSLDLGQQTKSSALKTVRDAGHDIAYVDLDQAFIAIKGDVTPAETPSVQK